MQNFTTLSNVSSSTLGQSTWMKGKWMANDQVGILAEIQSPEEESAYKCQNHLQCKKKMYEFKSNIFPLAAVYVL